MTDTGNLAAAMLGLETAQATEVLRELLLDADLRAGTAHAGFDLAARAKDDTAFLREVLQAADHPGEPEDPAASPQQLLSAIVTAVPALTEPAGDALIALEERETTLDIASSLDVASIAIAASAAIIRPLVTFEKKRDGDHETTRIRIDVRGIQDLGAVLRALLPFLPGGKNGNR